MQAETSSYPEDLRDLLPHFTTQLSMELEKRLVKRIKMEYPTEYGTILSYVSKGAENLARQIVRRMYRTQLKEAQALISFSDAVLAYNRPRMQERMDEQVALLPGPAQQKLKAMFQARRSE